MNYYSLDSEPYAELATLHLRLAPGLALTDTTWDDLLAGSLAWATAWIDGNCHRHFRQFSQTRYFLRDALDPDYFGQMYRENNRFLAGRVLLVDEDLLSVSSLKNGDGTVLGSSLYWLEPRNEVPHFGIRLKSDNVWTWDIDSWVEVTGQWGYSADPPPEIQNICLRLAEWHFRSRAPTDSTTVFDASYSTKMPAGFPLEVSVALDPFVRIAR